MSIYRQKLIHATKGDRFRDLGSSTVRFVSTTGKRSTADATTNSTSWSRGARQRRSGQLIATERRPRTGWKELAVGVVRNATLQDIGKGRDVK